MGTEEELLGVISSGMDHGTPAPEFSEEPIKMLLPGPHPSHLDEAVWKHGLGICIINKLPG